MKNEAGARQLIVMTQRAIIGMDVGAKLGEEGRRHQGGSWMMWWPWFNMQ